MMTARRQPSTTSLAKFARTGSPVDQQGTFDFCNSFWGIADGGVDVLLARMRGATRTMEELKIFWKERAVIEEDYAKKLAKLAKLTLGKDEINDLRKSLNTIKDETDRQATFHMTLAQQIRTELEAPCGEFHAKQVQHKKTQQSSIERQFKAKQLQEAHVEKAREKYEQDCMRINSYTAQLSLVQGKDWEKIQLKLERAKQSVPANERDFMNFTRAMESTVQKWELDWKAFCDSCQDLEEARIQYMKDNMWAYTNFVSSVCVADDESCERVRISLEHTETEREIENFVRDYGTGSQIPDPPSFVNYQLSDAVPSSASRPSHRHANFTRSPALDVPIQLLNHAAASAQPPRSHPPQHQLQHQPPPPPQPQPEDEPIINTAGIGAHRGQQGQQFQSQQRQSYVNGNGHHQSPSLSQKYPNSVSDSSPSPATGTHADPSELQRKSTSANPISQGRQSLYRSSPVAHDPLAEPIDPTAETYIKVGTNAYKADPLKDPQVTSRASLGRPASLIANNQGSGSGSNSGAVSTMAKQNGVDPLQKQLEELQNVVSATGNTRRNTIRYSQVPEQVQGQEQRSPTNAAGSSNMHHKGAESLSAGGVSFGGLSRPRSQVSPSPQGRSPSPLPQSQRSPGPEQGPGRDYRNSAELVVGAPPTASPSEPASPNPPRANFMIPKHTAPPSGSEVVQVLADYQQRLPGERKVLSQSGSRRSSFAGGPLVSEVGSIGSIGQGMGGGGHGHKGGPGQVHRHSLSFVSQPNQTLAQPSSIGRVGVGAHGSSSRSTSPQPQHLPPSRGPSPGPGEIVNVNNVIQAQQQQQQQQRQSPQPQFSHPSRPSSQLIQQKRNSTFMAPPSANASATPNRATSPNNVGIALDPSGRVSHDEMAQRYQAQQQQHHHQQHQQIQQQRGQVPLQQGPGGVQQYNSQMVTQQQAQAQAQAQAPRRSSYMGGGSGGVNTSSMIAPPVQPHYPSVTPPPQQMMGMGTNVGVGAYQQPQQQGYPLYGQYQQQGAYGMAMPSSAAGPSLQGQGQGQGQLQRSGTMGGPGGPGGPFVAPLAPQQHNSPNQGQSLSPSNTLAVHGQGGYNDYREASPGVGVNMMARSASPQPQAIAHQPQPQQTIPPMQPNQPMYQQPLNITQAQQLKQQGPFNTGQTTEDGTPILFYVKALYNYQATIDEEFDFQAGDVIAVTSTPEDGWWSGELLDETRRQRGRYIFPSNFVCLF